MDDQNQKFFLDDEEDTQSVTVPAAEFKVSDETEPVPQSGQTMQSGTAAQSGQTTQSGAAVHSGQTAQPGSGYSWQPYQPSGEYAYSSYHYSSEPEKKKEKNEPKPLGKGGRILLGILGVILSLAVVFGTAWAAASVAFHSWSAKENGKPDNGPISIGIGSQVQREDAQELQNSTYSTVGDLVEDVSHSLATVIADKTYATVVIAAEDEDEIYLVTAYHVTASAQNLKLVFGTDSSVVYYPELVSSDIDTDTAVLKLKKADIDPQVLKTLKIATFGDSESLILGDVAVSFSSPLGYFNTPSIGAISGLERPVSFTIANQSISLDMIQTDAGVNTSGVLFNGRGEVIGMTVNLTIEDSEGISFAIPASRVLDTVTEILEKGYVVKPYLGFTGYDAMNFYPNNSQVSWAEYYKLPTGILVATVVDNSPVLEAGLEVYDLIIGFNGQTIENFDDLKGWLDECEVGQEVTMEIVRGYLDGEAQTMELTVTIAQKPQQ